MWRTAPHKADIARVLFLLLLSLVVVFSHLVFLKLLAAELHVRARGLMVHKLLLLCLLAVLGLIILAHTSTTIIDIHWFKRLTEVRICGGAVWRL